MNGKEQTEKLNELNQIDKLTCTDSELDEYMNYGLLFKTKSGYKTRNGKIIDVEVMKSRNYRFNINLGNLLSQCEEIALKGKIKRIYCMSERTYNKYKEQQLIICKGDIEYYRLFENELWRILVI